MFLASRYRHNVHSLLRPAYLALIACLAYRTDSNPAKVRPCFSDGSLGLVQAGDDLGGLGKIHADITEPRSESTDAAF